MRTHPSFPRVLSCFPAAAALLILGSGCGPKVPTEAVQQRYRWVMMADRDVMTYACPEAQRTPLEAEDPLGAATTFVHRGKQLENWATDEMLEVASETPESMAPALDSLKASIGQMARAFIPAISMAQHHDRECNGEFALNCTRLIRARDVIGNIDGFTMRPALEGYLRHRAALAEAFADEGAPLDKVGACREGPPPTR